MSAIDQMGGLHQGNSILTSGKPIEEAGSAMILLHGRGASARDILTLTVELENEQFAYLAPQASNYTWYPYSFLAPIENNEPWLSSALDLVGEVLKKVSAAGLPFERTMLLGFSQGACLAVEFAARNPNRYGGVIGFSGGLIGPQGKNWAYKGSLEDTPVFLGCSDVDPHIPKERVQETSYILKEMGAKVTTKLYPGMGHTVNIDELEHAKEMMRTILT